MPDADPQDPQTPPSGYFTQADLDEAIKQAKQAARTEEREKLYPQMDRTKQEQEELAAQVRTLTEAERARQKAAEKAQADAEKARKEKERAELSAKEQIAETERAFQAQLAEMQKRQADQMTEWQRQRELDQAMMTKEREMAALQLYIRDRVEAERDNIAPELLDFIDGETKEQVDAAIQVVKDKTASLVEGMRQAGLAQRAAMPGTAPSAGATGITPGLDTGQGQAITAEDIKGMGMKDFAILRQKMGMGQAGQGIFQ